MPNLLRTLALSRAKYDRVTTICLVLGVGAALAYEHNSDLAWLAFAVAGAATATAASLYFCRRLARRAPGLARPLVSRPHTHELSPPSDWPAPAETLISIHLMSLGSVAGSFKRGEALLGAGAPPSRPLYWASEVRTAKYIEWAKAYDRQSGPVFASAAADTDRAREYVIACLFAMAGQSHIGWRSPTRAAIKAKGSAPKLRASADFSWVDENLGRSVRAIASLFG